MLEIYLRKQKHVQKNLLQNWNVEYNQVTYQILKIKKVYSTIANNFDQFEIILSLLTAKINILSKKKVLQTTQICKIETNGSHFPSQLVVENTFLGTARVVLFMFI